MLRRLLRDYLSLTRGERRGLHVLSLLVLLLILFRTFLPRMIHPVDHALQQSEAEFIAFQDSLRELETWYAGYSGVNQLTTSGQAGIPDSSGLMSPPEFFPFDPNAAEQDELIRLGLPERTARILVNYREAGGRFKVDSDLLKIYGMEPEVFNRLKPFIRIREKPADPDAKTGKVPAQYITQVFELNAADSIQLVSVYGIGPVFAHRIIRYRDLLGGFHSRGQLMEVYGFSYEQQEELTRRSFIDTTIIRKMNINSVEADVFCRHPYLDPYQSEALVEYRELMGAYEYRIQILENRLLPDSVYRKIRPYLEVMR